MKINWGWSIAIFFTLFASFIIFATYRFSRMNEDLVSEDYYSKELLFQKNIDAAHNSIKYNELATCRLNENGDVLITLHTNEGENKAIKAEVDFYKPDNKKDDFHIEKVLSGYPSVIDMHGKPKGHWYVTVNWENNGHSCASSFDFIK